jgi:hypothetical protein
MREEETKTARLHTRECRDCGKPITRIAGRKRCSACALDHRKHVDNIARAERNRQKKC